MGRRFIIVCLLIAAVALPLLHLHLIDKVMPFRHNDLIGRWVGARAALDGQNPYSPEVLRSMQTAYYGRPLTPADQVDAQAFLYPATIVLPLAPLTRFSWPAVALVFLLFTTPLMILAFWLSARALPLPLSTRTRAIAVLLALFSWPTVWGLRLLQPTLPLVAAILIAWFLLTRGQHVFPGILLAFAAIKPQIVFPLLFWLLLWTAVRRSWKFAAAFIATLALLLAATQALLPGWFAHWRSSLHNYSVVTLSAPPLEWTFGHWIGLALTITIAATGSLILWRLRFASPQSPQFALALGLVLSITLCIVPTHLAMVYNQILLLPGTLILICSHPAGYYAALTRRIAIALFACSWVGLFIALIGEGIAGPSDFWAGIPCRTMLLPASLAVALTLQAAETLSRRVPHAAPETKPSREPVAAV